MSIDEKIMNNNENEFVTLKPKTSFPWKPLGFALLVILSAGGLAAAGCGLGGFGAHHLGWNVAQGIGSLGQTHTIALMGAGGGIAVLGGAVATVVGVKTFRKPEEQIEQVEIEDETDKEVNDDKREKTEEKTG